MFSEIGALLMHDPLVRQHGGDRGFELSGSRFHSQWETYGQGLRKMMSELRSRWPNAVRPELQQFVYGYDRTEKKAGSKERDMLELHYFLETLETEAGLASSCKAPCSIDPT